jgi:tetratricopeptide (TPR) repeat protein
MGMGSREFYGNLDLDPTHGEGERTQRELSIHYQAAWTLVHMLLTSPEYTDPFGKYLQRLHAGKCDADAWNETLGQLPANKLAHDYQMALVPNEIVQIRHKWSPPAYRAGDSRSMGSSEVHTLWARLCPDTAQGQSDATGNLAEARRQMGPGAPRFDADLVLAEAYFKAVAKQREVAAQELRAAAAAHPEDPRLWNALGSVMVWEGMEGKDRQGRPQLMKTLADVGARLAPLATSTAELHLLAIIEKEANERFDVALGYEKRALAIDPNCHRCRAWAAVILYRQGFVREAVETATLALGLLEEGKRDSRLEAQVAKWRQELEDLEKNTGNRSR